MDNERAGKWELDGEGLKLLERIQREQGEDERKWWDFHKERHPVYSPTQEVGDFSGAFGYLTGAGARVFPYYQTPSGVVFYEVIDSRFGYKTTLAINVEGLRSSGNTHFYNEEEWCKSD